MSVVPFVLEHTVWVRPGVNGNVTTCIDGGLHGCSVVDNVTTDHEMRGMVCDVVFPQEIIQCLRRRGWTIIKG